MYVEYVEVEPTEVAYEDVKYVEVESMYVVYDDGYIELEVIYVEYVVVPIDVGDM